MKQQSLSELQAEVGAIRQTLANLEARQGNAKLTHATRRRAFSKGGWLGWIPWVASIALVSGLAYAAGEALFIDANGNAGIGTNTPDRPLTIRGSGRAGEWLSLRNNQDKKSWHINNNNGGLNFVETGVADGRLYLKTGGNVGIGTTDPTATLDVRGSIKASGRFEGNGAVPARAVMAFADETCPQGWTEYERAYGRFIRGIDKGKARVDPDGKRSPGTTQKDAIRNITGQLIGVNGAGDQAYGWGFRPGNRGAIEVANNSVHYNRYGGGGYLPSGGVGHTASFDASRSPGVRIAGENRPKNVALLYCIKS